MSDTLAGGMHADDTDDAARRDRVDQWLRMKKHGAPPDQVRAVIDWLQWTFGDKDRRQIADAIKPRPRRKPRRRKGRAPWKSAEGIQTRQEIKARWDPESGASWGLSQEKTCAKWQEECSDMPDRRDWYFVKKMDARSLAKAVFGRSDKLA